ncbi:MAG: methyl-accepting chemotaxis protein [Lachnospiraceae bacterium]|nr:methyl-accepting chemotaxis protein [Lachnospiraceae bacterium]
MKQKTRRLSIRYKILIPATIIIVLVCVVLGSNSYLRIKEGLIDMAIEEATLAADIATDSVNSTWVADIKPGDEGSVTYNLLLSQLRQLKDQCGMLYMLTLYLENGKVYYGVDSDEGSSQYAIGDEADIDYDMLLSVMDGETASEGSIDTETSEGYALISVYAPVTDENGTVVGILGCEYNAASAQETINGTATRVIEIALICMILAIVVLHVIINAIMKNLMVINQKIYDLVNNEGDLTQTLSVSSGDEMELIAENINSLLKYMRTIMQNISSNSTQINDSSHSMADSLSDAEMNITDVSATMEQMSAAMEETSASMNQIAESVNRIYGQVEAIYKKAEDGMDYTNKIRTNAVQIRTDAVASQSGAKNQVDSMTAAMNEKIERSKAVQEISALTENIISITEQTNLLSLNASIEAARAGEAGRGFAVVADEIGKLANSSSEAAERIQQVSGEVIAAVNDLSKEAELMVEFVNKTTMSGYKNLVSTGDSYQGDAGSLYDMMEGFSQTADDLRQNMDSIKEAVEAVNIAVEESAKGVTNVSEMSVNLTEIVNSINEEARGNQKVAGSLNDEVGKFKI